MKVKKLLFLSLSACVLALAGCNKASTDATKDTSPISIDTGSSEDTNTKTEPSSEDTNTDSSSSGEDTSTDTNTNTITGTVIPEPGTYSITVVTNGNSTYNFGELNLEKVLPEAQIIFSVTAKKGYLISSVKLDNETLTGNANIYTFSMPNKDVVVTITTEEEPAPEKYVVTGKNIENVNFNLFEKTEFEVGSTVAFTFGAKDGYAIRGFEITRDDTNASIEYTGTTFIEFEMPSSNVSVTFNVERIYKISTIASAHTKITVNPDKYLYEANTEISVTVQVTDDKYQLDSFSVIDSSGKTISTKLEDSTYKFTMPASNVTISTTESEKPVEEDPVDKDEDPFLTKTTFEGTWSYYDGYTDYDMHFRVVFNGDKTLNWYLTYEYYEDEWGYDWTYDGGSNELPERQYATVYSKPSDMVGDFKAGETGVEYTYDKETDQIKYSAKVKTSSTECTLQIIRTAGNIQKIKMLNDMSGDYYQSKDCTLSKK